MFCYLVNLILTENSTTVIYFKLLRESYVEELMIVWVGHETNISVYCNIAVTIALGLTEVWLNEREKKSHGG